MTPMSETNKEYTERHGQGAKACASHKAQINATASVKAEVASRPLEKVNEKYASDESDLMPNTNRNTVPRLSPQTQPSERGRGKGGINPPICKYCVNRTTDHLHHIKDCVRAPHCTSCHFNGHDSTACGAKEQTKKVCSRCNQKDVPRMGPEKPNTNTHGLRFSEMTKKEKKVKRNQMKEQKKQTQKITLNTTYVGLSAEEALATAPKILNTPNTLNSKVGEDNPMLIGDDDDNRPMLRPPSEDSSTDEEDEDPNVPGENPDEEVIDMPATTEHLWKQEKIIRTLRVPTSKEAASALILYGLKTFIFTLISEALEIPTEVEWTLTIISVVFTLYYLYRSFVFEGNLVQVMTSTYQGEGKLDSDLRTDVQKISDLKHAKTQLYKADFSWRISLPNSNIENTKPLKERYILAPDGTPTTTQTMFQSLGLSVIKAPPISFVYSGEAAAQFIGPNNFDLIGTSDESQTRINYTLRNLGSINNDRFKVINHNSVIRDAAIASVIMVHDERWRKNALSLN